MPQPAPSVDGTFRVLRTIHLAMLISVFLYIWVAEKVLRHSQQSPDRVFTTSIGVLAATVFVAAIVVRVKMVQPALDLLQTKPGDETIACSLEIRKHKQLCSGGNRDDVRRSTAGCRGDVGSIRSILSCRNRAHAFLASSAAVVSHFATSPQALYAAGNETAL